MAVVTGGDEENLLITGSGDDTLTAAEGTGGVFPLFLAATVEDALFMAAPGTTTSVGRCRQ